MAIEEQIKAIEEKPVESLTRQDILVYLRLQKKMFLAEHRQLVRN